MKYTGSCHCKQIAFAVEGDLQQVMECNCSICSKRGALHWFVPRDRLTLATPESALSTYTFNRHRIQHRFCSQCGCAPFAESHDANGVAMAAVNARCLDGVDLTGVKRIPFDGRSL